MPDNRDDNAHHDSPSQLGFTASGGRRRQTSGGGSRLNYDGWLRHLADFRDAR